MIENAIAVQERPILFSGAIVRAVIEGRKTQTRRVAKLICELADKHESVRVRPNGDKVNVSRQAMHTPTVREHFETECPYGKPGDRLWVRETFARCACDACRSIWPAKTPHGILGYRATYGGPSMMVFKPSIHMPRWASRITLEIVSVKVERVQEISEADAVAEGLRAQVGGGTGTGPGFKWKGIGYEGTTAGQFHAPMMNGLCCCHIGRNRLAPAVCVYRELWDSINSRRGYGWEKNPFVWAIEFKAVK